MQHSIPLRIATFNVYLISQRFNSNRETHPEERASRIYKLLCHRVKPIDVLFCQEVWGVGLDRLVRSPHSTTQNVKDEGRTDKTVAVGNGDHFCYDVPPNRSPWRFNLFFPWWSEIFNTTYLHLQQTGGLYDFARKQNPEPMDHGHDHAMNRNMVCLYRHKHTFSVSQSKSRKGVEATLWTIPQWGYRDDKIADPKSSNARQMRRLLVFNTHLDPTPQHQGNRRQQINEIIQFVSETIHQIEQLDMEEEKDATATDVNWSDTGVVMVGDFNIKAMSEEYQNVFVKSPKDSLTTPNNERLLRWNSDGDDDDHDDGRNGCGKSSYSLLVQDLFWKEGETPDDKQQHTYAEQNSLAVCPNDYGRIDYIFAVKQLSFSDPIVRTSHDDYRLSQCQHHEYNFMPLNVVSKQIRYESYGKESSDHYALIVDILPSQKD